MYARVTHFTSDLAKLDEGIRRINDSIIPWAKRAPGFKGGYWLVDRNSGKGLGVTLFESEEAVRSSEASAKQQRDQTAASGVAEPSEVEVYAVVAQA
jgi:hypothetical protein